MAQRCDEGTVREHNSRARSSAVGQSSLGVPGVCGIFVDVASPACPRFPRGCSMVRRGSTVRVRQRALQKRRTSGFCSDPLAPASIVRWVLSRLWSSRVRNPALRCVRRTRGPALAQTLTTTLPRARPSLRYRMASATSLNAKVLSTTGLTVPASKNSRNTCRSSLRAIAISVPSF
jgi:hypothetical protein